MKKVFLVLELQIQNEMNSNQIIQTVDDSVDKMKLKSEQIYMGYFSMYSTTLTELIGNVIREQIDKQIKKHVENGNRALSSYGL